jgi:hypothetical protein
MPTIQNPNSHEPNQTARTLWLATRKVDFFAGGFPVPGLFVDDKVNIDKTRFWISVTIELIGVIAMIAGGFMFSGGNFGLVAVFGALFLFALDFIAANRLHRRVAIRTYIRSRKFLYQPFENLEGVPNAMRSLDEMYNKGKGQDIVWTMCIIFNAVIKLIAIFALSIFESLGDQQIFCYLLFALLYGWACYIHIYHTGYALAYNTAEKAFNKGDALIQDPRTGIYESVNKYEITSRVANKPNVIAATDQHYLIDDLDKNTDEFKHYLIQTHGVLVDEQIKRLIDRQSNFDAYEIAYRCRSHQISDMCTPPTDDTKEIAAFSKMPPLPSKFPAKKP